MPDVADHRYGLYLHELFGKDVPAPDDFVMAAHIIKAYSPAVILFPVALWRKRTLWFCHGWMEQGANSEYILSTRVTRNRERMRVTVDARYTTGHENTAGFRACQAFSGRPGAEQEDIVTGFLRTMSEVLDPDSKCPLLRLLAVYG